MRPIVLTAALLAACTAAPPPAADPVAAPQTAGYGMDKATAVEVCQPSGQRAYLQRLRCADGSAPQFSRRGSMGLRNPIKSKADEESAMSQVVNYDALPAGATDFHTVDVYEVRCGDEVTDVFLDMYHCQQAVPSQAPPGFTIVN
jgi:hypothetical protein